MAGTYEIVALGAAGPIVRAAFEDFEIEDLADGRIRLVGEVVDDAALHGVLHRLQDLRLTIVELRRRDRD
ncbi:hypothetical protein MU582_03265 [Nocardioidaceae bacterium SCSIO 66511]|nr:hypothetical protein MU582_03265 [Nocardioidaceae bacterium SCSIO 66511]